MKCEKSEILPEILRFRNLVQDFGWCRTPRLGLKVSYVIPSTAFASANVKRHSTENMYIVLSYVHIYKFPLSAQERQGQYHRGPEYPAYIANHSRWKSSVTHWSTFVVSRQSCIAKAYCTDYFTEKVSQLPTDTQNFSTMND